MQTTPIIQNLLADLAAIAELAPEQGPTAPVVRQLTRALEASAERSVLDALSEAAVELNSQLPSGHVEVRLVGRDPEFVFVPEDESHPPAPDDSTTARITLRLSDSLKAGVELAAARDGLSVNTWIVRALTRATTGSPPRSGNRLSGWARS
jgi:hypothetical protein